eukprot:6273464-Alexandrium_andersonii.AAC.1
MAPPLTLTGPAYSPPAPPPSPPPLRLRPLPVPTCELCNGQLTAGDAGQSFCAACFEGSQIIVWPMGNAARLSQRDRLLAAAL